MNKLTKRLQVIFDLVSSRVIADVGCDHGKLTKALFDKNKIDFAYVSDISKLSLEKAIKLLKDYDGKFEAICCDGLSDYKDQDIGECIIAGMGGSEIIKIIENSPIEISKYILSPQHNEIDVKKFMISCGYAITYDIIILDKGKFYNIFKCEKSESREISDYELLFGKQNFSSDISDIKKYVEFYLEKYRKIFQQNNSQKIEDLIKLFEIAKKECEKLWIKF